jgi:hypothetical protein
VYEFLRKFWAWWKGKLNQGPCECKAKMLSNKLLHNVMWITHVIQPILRAPRVRVRQHPKFTFLSFTIGLWVRSSWNWHEIGYIRYLDCIGTMWCNLFPFSRKCQSCLFAKGVASLWSHCDYRASNFLIL